MESWLDLWRHFHCIPWHQGLAERRIGDQVKVFRSGQDPKYIVIVVGNLSTGVGGSVGRRSVTPSSSSFLLDQVDAHLVK